VTRSARARITRHCDPQSLREYAAHLDRERNALPLWDTRGFAAEFERLLELAYGEVTSA
jgi:predicted O-linked N-acetylglucosamine transferase (SPINDLY family)